MTISQESLSAGRSSVLIDLNISALIREPSIGGFPGGQMKTWGLDRSIDDDLHDPKTAESLIMSGSDQMIFPACRVSGVHSLCGEV